VLFIIFADTTVITTLDAPRSLLVTAVELIGLHGIFETLHIMRPPRVLIAVAFFLTTVILTFVSLRSSHPPQTIATPTRVPRTGIQSFFSFRAPFSLFPPNAIITLTHENSTAFLARPAAFGPRLPTEGLNGQVWIGSGFGEDSIREGIVAAGAAGELGCSDVPGWVESYTTSSATTTEGPNSVDAKIATMATRSRKRGIDEDREFVDRIAEAEDPPHERNDISKPTIDDGTDDYLHHPLPVSTVSKPTDPRPVGFSGNHADIQSIQEGAEIAGKIVLLSRGGCGFLEKVKWAQRRGAIALIVGDDTKGGALIQMYARGDTSNVTIPSIFTSRTTAHLLSSLVGSGNFIEDSVDEKGNPTLKVQHNDKPKKYGKKHNLSPTFVATTAATKATMTARAASRASKKMFTSTVEKPSPITTERPGWLKSLLFGPGRGNSKSDSSRPPSSGRLDWVLVDDWKDDDTVSTKKISAGKSNKKADSGTKKSKAGDDFVIGVQDWRDPDLIGSSGPKDIDNGFKIKPEEKTDATKTKKNKPRPTKSGKKHTGGALQDIPEHVPNLGGGSITPGSGEYGAKVESEMRTAKSTGEQKHSAKGESSKSILTAIFGEDEEDVDLIQTGSSTAYDSTTVFEADDDDDEEYDGLWVTLTPTSGASPFLDTLLVLVVSPLVTLTVVYALLLVRSRIRRRRWRAPKSVVERLPVRTYQTIATPGNQSPRLPSPTSSSAATPLLQQLPIARPRPRSRTTTGIPEPGDLIRVNSNPLEVSPQSPVRGQEREKNTGSISTEWKKYMGKQVECVVCLEEYVDGVSRVMSLPCGHEFHADCM
jgi:hypothetical protein